MHAIHSIHAIHADTFRYILMLMIHVHTYIIHATYMLYIQIHSNIYTSLLHCDVAVILLCMYVFVCIACMQSDTHRYIHIHVHTCSYIHIHTHTYPPQSVAWRGFGVLLLPHATPMRSSTYPDLLGRGSGWDLHAAFARWGPMGGARELLSPSPTRAGRTGAPKLVWAWVPDRWIRWQGCCPWPSWVGPARCSPPGGCFRPVVGTYK